VAVVLAVTTCFLSKRSRPVLPCFFLQGRKQRCRHYCDQLICQSVKHRLSLSESAFPKVYRLFVSHWHKSTCRQNTFHFPSTTSPLTFFANFAASSACMFSAFIIPRSRDSRRRSHTMLFAAKTIISTRRSFARLVLIPIVTVNICRHILFSFSWAGHSGCSMPSSQCKCSQFFLTSPSTLKREVRHKNAALPAQVRRRVRS
jgi:hypothetical protein